MKTKSVAYSDCTGWIRPTDPPGAVQQQKELCLSPSKIHCRFALVLGLFGAFLASAAWGSVAGSISGSVKDPAGNVIASAQVTVRGLGTGISYQTHSSARGYYTLPVLPVGHYELAVEAPGFQSYLRENIVLDTDASLTLDAVLAVGGDTQTVSVTDNALHVETVSTQLGEVISGRQMTAAPLNGRSFTDLLCSRACLRLRRSDPILSKTWERRFLTHRARSIPERSPSTDSERPPIISM